MLEAIVSEVIIFVFIHFCLRRIWNIAVTFKVMLSEHVTVNIVGRRLEYDDGSAIDITKSGRDIICGDENSTVVTLYNRASKWTIPGLKGLIYSLTH